jgi:FHS family L-fucose permease-like MFS transporter
LPAGSLTRRFGYKKVIVMGLLWAATGAGLFYPAAMSMSFGFFLFALFVLASGMTFLETAANPFITVLGAPETASQRLNFAQAFNGLGAFIASIFLSKLIISKEGIKTAAELQLLSPAMISQYYHTLFQRVKLPYLLIGAVLVFTAILFLFIKFPGFDTPTKKNKKELKVNVFEHANLLGGIVAQFFYVGAQICVSSFFILYITSATNITEYEATNYLGLLLLGFMLGRYVGSFLIRYIDAGKLLFLYAIINVVLMLLIVITKGSYIVWLFFAVEFFMSIMYPTIFSLAIKDQGERTPIASSYMVMAITGGAIFPLILGYVADRTGSMHTAYIVPFVCFFPVAWFGWKQRAGAKRASPRSKKVVQLSDVN